MDIFNRKRCLTLGPTMIYITDSAGIDRDWLEYVPFYSFPLNYISQYKSHLLTAQSFFSQITSFFLSILDPQSNASPSWSTLLLLCVVLYLSLKVVDMLWRAIWFWTSFILKIILWLSIALAGLYVWTRGIEGSYEDLEYYVEYWMNEYGTWQKQAQIANSFRKASGDRPAKRWW
jgi:hypothetical protein